MGVVTCHIGIALESHWNPKGDVYVKIANFQEIIDWIIQISIIGHFDMIFNQIKLNLREIKPIIFAKH